jgi:IS30 family transposase
MQTQAVSSTEPLGQTLTTDNGKEFAQHKRVASALDAEFFFAHPYSS